MSARPDELLSQRLFSTRSRFRRRTVPRQFLDQAIDLAADLYAAGHSYAAIHLLSDGAGHFTVTPHHEFRHQLAMGNLLAHTGQWNRSSEHQAKALTLVSSSGKRSSVLATSVSIAGNSAMSGRYKHAARYIRLAEDYMSGSLPSVLAALRGNEAYLHILCGNPRLGFKALLNARHLAQAVERETHVGRNQHAILDLLEVRLRVCLQDYDRAYEIASDAFARSQGHNDLSAAWARSAYGLANVSIGNLVEGYLHLGDAWQITSGVPGAQAAIRETSLFANILAHQYDHALRDLLSLLNDTVPPSGGSSRNRTFVKQDRRAFLLELADRLAQDNVQRLRLKT